MDWELLDQFGLNRLLLAEGGPTVDGAYVISIVSRAVHLLSAMILVGGLFYQRTVLAPSGVDSWFAGRRAVWARWVGITTFLLLASGIYNLMTIIKQAKAAGAPLEPTYHMLFGIKFLLALLVMFIAAMLAGKTATAERFRAQMPKWLNISWLAAIAIVVLAAILRTFL